MVTHGNHDNALSPELIAEEQQRLANKYLSKDDESESDRDVDEYVSRSKKFNEKNLLPHVLVKLSVLSELYPKFFRESSSRFIHGKTRYFRGQSFPRIFGSLISTLNHIVRSMNLARRAASEQATADMLLRNILTVKKVAKKFTKRNTALVHSGNE